MSVVLVGLSYRCAPVSLLEKVTISPQDRGAVATALLQEETVSEALVLSTCNRTEFYLVSDGFHSAVEHIVDVISHHSGVAVRDLLPHLFVRYAESAAEHMLRVAAGLDSMVIGEQQVIGQIRDAYQSASDGGYVGRTLHELCQRALRTGKRVHSETRIDDEGPSMVSYALDEALSVLGRADLSGARALVVGAGAMSSLAATHLGRLGATLMIANRTLDRAENLADHARQAGVSATAHTLQHLEMLMAQADIVVTATGAMEPIVSTGMLRRVSQQSDSDLVICDLSMPRDVATGSEDFASRNASHITVLNIEQLSARRKRAEGGESSQDEATRARTIVAEELAAHLTAERSHNVVPTVKALRQRGAEILAAEQERLDSRTPELSDEARDEVHRAMKRLVDKLMHTPTVQLKRLSAHSDVSYADALRELFELAPGTVDGLSAHSTTIGSSRGSLGGAPVDLTADKILGVDTTQPRYDVPQAMPGTEWEGRLNLGR